VYHGVAFGWMEPVVSTPHWSINFHTSQTNAEGAPVLSTFWLKPTANVFDGSDMVHLMISVWSGASTNFDLSVTACYVHVVIDVSGVSQVPRTATVTQTTTETATQTTTETATQSVTVTRGLDILESLSELNSISVGILGGLLVSIPFAIWTLLRQRRHR
jgi:hypothetical protein